jgi:hypothetical protein
MVKTEFIEDADDHTADVVAAAAGTRDRYEE